MHFGQIEQELVDGEPWFPWQQTKLPHHLQQLVDQEQTRLDIWECEHRGLQDQTTTPKMVQNSTINHP